MLLVLNCVLWVVVTERGLRYLSLPTFFGLSAVLAEETILPRSCLQHCSSIRRAAHIINTILVVCCSLDSTPSLLQYSVPVLRTQCQLDFTDLNSIA